GSACVGAPALGRPLPRESPPPADGWPGAGPDGAFFEPDHVARPRLPPTRRPDRLYAGQESPRGAAGDPRLRLGPLGAARTLRLFGGHEGRPRSHGHGAVRTPRRGARPPRRRGGRAFRPGFLPARGGGAGADPRARRRPRALADGPPLKGSGRGRTSPRRLRMLSEGGSDR